MGTKVPQGVPCRRSASMKEAQKKAQAIREAEIQKDNTSKAETDAIKKIGHAPKYTNSILMAYRIAKYFYDCDNNRTKDGEYKQLPYTRKGLMLYLYICKSTFESYLEGNLDYLITQQKNGKKILSTSGVQSQKIVDTPTELIDYIALMVMIPPEVIKDAINGDLTALMTIKEVERTIFFSDVLGNAVEMINLQRENDLYIKGRVADIFTAKNFLGMKDEQTITNNRLMISSEDAQKMLNQLMQ